MGVEPSRGINGKEEKMKYNLIGTVTGSKYLGTVEAESAEEAIEKAYKLDTCSISLCHQCTDECEDPEITEIIAELDED